MNILQSLLEQYQTKLKGNLYHFTQIMFSYNTNRIEGSTLTEEDTRYIFETNSFLPSGEIVNVDDIIETKNHFELFDYMLETVYGDLSEDMIKDYHQFIKKNTEIATKAWFNLGDYKQLANVVGNRDTVEPAKVSEEMKKLIKWYLKIVEVEIKDIIEFHYRFEVIHPFQDGNGRVGRIIMFKECLKHNIIPFVIQDQYKLFYYRGLKEYEKDKSYLMDTCLSAQDFYTALCHKFLK